MRHFSIRSQPEKDDHIKKLQQRILGDAAYIMDRARRNSRRRDSSRDISLNQQLEQQLPNFKRSIVHPNQVKQVGKGQVFDFYHNQPYKGYGQQQ